MEYGRKELKRIKKAFKQSYKKLSPFRQNRIELLSEYVGSIYGDEGEKKKPVPVNIIALAVMIYARNLFARSPHVLVNTEYPELKPRAAKFELGLDHLLDEIKFKKQMDMTVINAMFGLGVMKVGLMGSGTVDIEGISYDYGQPYAKAIDLDDWVHDTCARTWDEVGFCGNRYVVPLEYAKELQSFNKKQREKLVAVGKEGYSSGEREDRVEHFGKSETPGYNEDEYRDRIELWDIWVPETGKIITISEQDGIDEPLAEMDWEGPESGPYHLLSFIDVPNNIMPVPPCAHWKDMHDLINSLMRKLGRQAKREKQIYGVMPGGEKDGDMVQKSSDGDIIGIRDPKNVAQLKFGGPDQATFMFSEACVQRLSWLAGNIDTLGGLGAQAETLGQEQLLATSSSKQLSEMQDRVIEINKVVIKDLGWWLWTDPLIEMPLTKQVAGTDIQIKTAFTPEDREGDFLDYNIDIQPYSMQDSTPSQELAKLNQTFQTIIMPGMGFMQQQGLGFNWEAFLRHVWKLGNLPGSMEEFITFMRPPMQAPDQAVQPGMETPKPATTTRIEKRISRPGASRDGNSAILSQMMANMGGVQKSEAAAFNGPVGV